MEAHLKFFLFILFSISQLHAGYLWTYEKKIAAEGACSQRFVTPVNRNRACFLGVRAYGDARGWQGINTTRNQAQSACNTLCTGAGDQRTYCQNGCQIGRDSDK